MDLIHLVWLDTLQPEKLIITRLTVKNIIPGPPRYSTRTVVESRVQNTVVSPSIAKKPSIAKNHIKNGVESKNLGFEIKMSLIIIIIN